MKINKGEFIERTILKKSARKTGDEYSISGINYSQL